MPDIERSGEKVIITCPDCGHEMAVRVVRDVVEVVSPETEGTWVSSPIPYGIDDEGAIYYHRK